LGTSHVRSFMLHYNKTMISIQGQTYEINSVQLNDKLNQLTKDTWVMVDWTDEKTSIQEIIQNYLEFVKKCHKRGFKVQVKMRIATAVLFSQAQEPIVFCGHTFNPFRFDHVVYSMER
jgi:hypothetical protein